MWWMDGIGEPGRKYLRLFSCILNIQNMYKRDVDIVVTFFITSALMWDSPL